MRVILSCVATALALGLSAPASAGDAKGSSTKAYDPEEKICEDIIATGSRLAVKRFCGTRAQWEEKRRLDRESVEKAQTSPCMLQRTTASGRPAC